MPLALVETKFFPPRWRPEQVARPRLDRVDARTRLVLVSAPAGFGKTTLLAAWLTGRPDRRVAWVSLDEADRRADSFWTYVLTALDRAAPGAGAAGLALLGTGQPVEAALAPVLNELSVLPDDVDLVLDDYHLAESPEVQPGVAFLLERLPPQVRLVLSTRADPALPLARLRARGELTEVRAADLRFTDEETARYLGEATGLDLAASDVAVLGARTEGWIASLQLAALSLRDRDDPTSFIAGFAGDDRYVVDYLVEEVLDRQPAEVREFLLATAVLDRLTGSLCDAVVGTSGSAQVLESLERRNLFVVPLDDRRQWYRYHHLFADVLNAHLHAERPDHVAELHRRASAWCADAGDPARAVRHALAAGEVERAADLVERAVPALGRDRQEAVIRSWADVFPPELVQRRPVLAIGLVGGLMSSNEFDGIEQRLHDVERALARPVDELVVLDRAELDRVPAGVEMYRAALALVGGDLPGAITHAGRAAELGVEGDDLTSAAAAGLTGLASWAMGDIVTAHGAYTTCARRLTRSGHIADVLGCSITLADMELTLGRLRDAERTLEDGLALAARHGPAPPQVMRGTADMLVGLSRVAWHRNDLAAAADLLRRADELGEPAGLPQNPYRWRVALARLHTAAGDHPTALELLDEAERVYVGDFSPQVHPIHATRARVLVAAGDLVEAEAWARRHEVGPDDELSYLREYEHVTLVKVLLAEQAASGTGEALDRATALLGRLEAAADQGGRTGTLIEVLALTAAARDAGGDRPAALASLERAATLAQPEGWVRVLLEAPPRLRAELARSRPDLTVVRDLTEPSRPPAASADPTPPGPVDPLSERELVVLRLLASDLDGPAIARELVVSLNTVRTHTKHIYAKLGVNSRRAAVSRAHQLGLLARS